MSNEKISRAVRDVHRLTMVAQSRLASVVDELPEIEATPLDEIFAVCTDSLAALDVRLVEYFGGAA